MRPGLQVQNEPPVSCELRRLVLGSLLPGRPVHTVHWWAAALNMREPVGRKAPALPPRSGYWERGEVKASVMLGWDKNPFHWVCGFTSHLRSLCGCPSTTWASVTARRTAHLLNQHRGTEPCSSLTTPPLGPGAVAQPACSSSNE